MARARHKGKQIKRKKAAAKRRKQRRTQQPETAAAQTTRPAHPIAPTDPSPAQLLQQLQRSTRDRLPLRHTILRRWTLRSEQRPWPPLIYAQRRRGRHHQAAQSGEESIQRVTVNLQRSTPRAQHRFHTNGVGGGVTPPATGAAIGGVRRPGLLYRLSATANPPDNRRQEPETPFHQRLPFRQPPSNATQQPSGDHLPRLGQARARSRSVQRETTPSQPRPLLKRLPSNATVPLYRTSQPSSGQLHVGPLHSAAATAQMSAVQRVQRSNREQATVGSALPFFSQRTAHSNAMRGGTVLSRHSDVGQRAAAPLAGAHRAASSGERRAIGDHPDSTSGAAGSTMGHAAVRHATVGRADSRLALSPLYPQGRSRYTDRVEQGATARAEPVLVRQIARDQEHTRAQSESQAVGVRPAVALAGQPRPPAIAAGMVALTRVQRHPVRHPIQAMSAQTGTMWRRRGAAQSTQPPAAVIVQPQSSAVATASPLRRTQVMTAQQPHEASGSPSSFSVAPEQRPVVRRAHKATAESSRLQWPQRRRQTPLTMGGQTGTVSVVQRRSNTETVSGSDGNGTPFPVRPLVVTAQSGVAVPGKAAPAQRPIHADPQSAPAALGTTAQQSLSTEQRSVSPLRRTAAIRSASAGRGQQQVSVAVQRRYTRGRLGEAVPHNSAPVTAASPLRKATGQAVKSSTARESALQPIGAAQHAVRTATGATTGQRQAPAVVRVQPRRQSSDSALGTGVHDNVSVSVAPEGPGAREVAREFRRTTERQAVTTPTSQGPPVLMQRQASPHLPIQRDSGHQATADIRPRASTAHPPHQPLMGAQQPVLGEHHQANAARTVAAGRLERLQPVEQPLVSHVGRDGQRPNKPILRKQTAPGQVSVASTEGTVYPPTGPATGATAPTQRVRRSATARNADNAAPVLAEMALPSSGRKASIATGDRRSVGRLPLAGPHVMMLANGQSATVHRLGVAQNRPPIMRTANGNAAHVGREWRDGLSSAMTPPRGDGTNGQQPSASDSPPQTTTGFAAFTVGNDSTALPLVQRQQSASTGNATGREGGTTSFTNGHIMTTPLATLQRAATESTMAGPTSAGMAMNGGGESTTTAHTSGAATLSEAEIERIATEVYTIIERRLTFEREVMGI